MDRMVTASALLFFSAVTVAAATPLAFERRGEQFITRMQACSPAALECSALVRQSGIALHLQGAALRRDPRLDLRLELDGADPAARLQAASPLPGIRNYMIGSDPRRWRINVPTYDRVEYGGVYPGVSLVFHGSERQLEHDFIVDPGADPNAIRLRMTGASRWKIDSRGDLVASAGGAEIRWHKPVVYQEDNGRRTEIPGRYTRRPGNRIGFAIGPYDRSKTLVIDPVLSIAFATYIGGSNYDYTGSVGVDAAGNVYVAGATLSTDYPTANALQKAYAGGQLDVVVSKFSPDGSKLLYSTFIGGSDREFAYGLAVDAAGNAYVTGESASSDFPAVNPIAGALTTGTHAFALKLNPSGSQLIYSTRFGGSTGESARGIAIDSSGNAYIGGSTQSSDFPLVGAFQPSFGGGLFGTVPTHGFVSKLAPTGDHFVYSTFLGGSDADGVNAIAIDGGGNAYVAGQTKSSDFPVKNALQAKLPGTTGSGFIAKLNAQGSGLVYSTFLGSSGSGAVSGIAVDSAGSAYATGNSAGAGFPLTAGSFQPIRPFSTAGPAAAFVSKLDPSGASLAYSTYLGGSTAGSSGLAIAVDAQGAAYVTGVTDDSDFPQAAPLPANLAGNPGRFFIAKLMPSGSGLAFSSFFGGPYTGFASSTAVAIDQAGNIYASGITSSSSFPGVNALQSAYGGAFDGFVVKFSLQSGGNGIPALASISPNAADIGSANFTLQVTGSGFLANSVVRWNGTAKPTTLVSATQLTAAISIADISQPGTSSVSVFTPSPGGGTSNFVAFTVNGSLPPLLVGIGPDHLTAGAPGGTLVVGGCYFAPNTVIRWNGSDRPTQPYVNNTGFPTLLRGGAFSACQNTTLLQAAITASDLAAAGTAQVTVYTPPPGGGTSSAESIVILPLPILSAGQILNGASYGSTLVAGELASLFGANFSLGGASAFTAPLQTSLQGVSVEINGTAAPLIYVGANQVNFQVPWELQGQSSATIDVLDNGVRTASQTFRLAAAAPAVFTLNSQGTGQGAVLFSGTSVWAGDSGVVPCSPCARAAKAGDNLEIYLTGLGAVATSQATGVPTSSATPTLTQATVTIGGIAAPVTYSGLATRYVGLNQVNVQVPAGVAPGMQVPLVVSIGGVASNTVTIAVQ
jgi:uncharacterized protein (TIGR03437 family)